MDEYKGKPVLPKQFVKFKKMFCCANKRKNLITILGTIISENLLNKRIYGGVLRLIFTLSLDKALFMNFV